MLEPMEERQLLTTYQGSVEVINWRDPMSEQRRFDQDAEDRLASYWHLAATTRTALEVYYAADEFNVGTDAKDLAEMGRIGPGNLVDYGPGMGEVRAARALLVAAAALYVEASKTPDPQGEALGKEANQLDRKAAPLVQAAIDFFFKAQGKWIDWLDKQDPVSLKGVTAWQLPPGFPLQAASAEEPREPFKLGVEQEFSPGRTLMVGGTEVQVESGGQPPVEAGVDWNTWYNKWIGVVEKDVWGTMKQGFAKDPNRYVATVTYTVDAQGRVVVNGGVTGGTYLGGNNWGLSARNLLNDLSYGKSSSGKLTTESSRVPAFPKGTKLTSVTRTFTFSWRSPTGGPEIKLGGPPKG